MKFLALFIGIALTSFSAYAQSTNAAPAPTVSTETVTLSVAPKEVSAYYRLVYIASTKKIVALVYSAGATQTPLALYTCNTYAQAQAFAVSNSLTGLPPQKKGQP